MPVVASGDDYSKPSLKIELDDGGLGGASPLRNSPPRAVPHNTRAFALPGIW